MSKPPSTPASPIPSAIARRPADGEPSRNGVAQPAQRTQVRGVPLGEALIRLGFVRAEDVEAALARQATDRRKLGEILVAGGKGTKDQIDRAMALQMGMGVFNTADGVDPSVVSLIDDRTARRYQAVPV